MYLRILSIFLICSVPLMMIGGPGVFLLTNSIPLALGFNGTIFVLFAAMGTAFYFSLATTVEAMREVLESLTVESIVAASQPVQNEEEEEI